MAKAYSDADNALLERAVREHTRDGRTDWGKVLKEVVEPGRKQTLEAVQIRYRRLAAQNGVKQSSRSGNKTWARTQKWIENLIASNQRLRAQLYAKKSKRRASARTEFLKKKIKELRDEVVGLKDELKSHAPALRFYAQARKTLSDPKVQRAIINKE